MMLLHTPTHLLLFLVLASLAATTSCREEDDGGNVPVPPVVSTLRAEKAGDGTGIVRTLPAGLICDVDCDSGSFDYQDTAEVVVVAEPSRTANFKKLTCTGGGETLTVDVIEAGEDARLTLATLVDGAGVDWGCTADFLQVHTLQVIANQGSGSGVVRGALSSVIGADEPRRMDCPSTETCVAAYFANEVETLTATPAAGSVFAGWEFCGDSDDAVIELTLADDINCRPVFDLQ